MIGGMGDGIGVCAVGLVVFRGLSVFCAVVVGCGLFANI